MPGFFEFHNSLKISQSLKLLRNDNGEVTLTMGRYDRGLPAIPGKGDLPPYVFSSNERNRAAILRKESGIGEQYRL
jgi:hypothetical protein